MNIALLICSQNLSNCFKRKICLAHSGLNAHYPVIYQYCIMFPARSHTFVEIDHEIIFYVHSPTFHRFIQEGFSVTREGICAKYWLTAYSSLPRKRCG